MVTINDGLNAFVGDHVVERHRSGHGVIAIDQVDFEVCDVLGVLINDLFDRVQNVVHVCVMVDGICFLAIKASEGITVLFVTFFFKGNVVATVNATGNQWSKSTYVLLE